MKKCVKCNQEKDDLNFYQAHNVLRGKECRHGRDLDICKDCLFEIIDIANRDTFDFVLEQLDLPFIEEVYESRLKRYRGIRSDRSIFGSYIALMNLLSYQHMRYQDTDKINQWYAESRKQYEEARQNESLL